MSDALDRIRNYSLSQAAYCTQHGLAAKSLSRWQLKEQVAPNKVPPPVSLIPVVI